jgi:ABC-type cobalt transport system substrate-binding protein
MAERWRWSLGLAALAILIVVGVTIAAGGLPGTDDAATGHQPWVRPLTDPDDAQQLALFALQAGSGAGVLGYLLGMLRERHTDRATAAGDPEPTAGR